MQGLERDGVLVSPLPHVGESGVGVRRGTVMSDWAVLRARGITRRTKGLGHRKLPLVFLWSAGVAVPLRGHTYACVQSSAASWIAINTPRKCCCSVRGRYRSITRWRLAFLQHPGRECTPEGKKQKRKKSETSRRDAASSCENR